MIDASPGPTVLVLMSALSPWSHGVVEQLTERGLRVHVLDFSHSSDAYLHTNRDLEANALASLRDKVAGVHVVDTPRPLVGRVFVGARTLRRIVRDTRANLVLTLYGGINATIALCSFVRPYIVYVVGSDVLLVDGARSIVTRLALHGADRVLANGQFLAARTRELAPRASVDPLYLGVDLRRFASARERRLRPRFLCTRGFSSVYDNQTVVRAIGALHEASDDFEMVFLSTGPDLADCVRLADRVIRAPIRTKVTFTGGASDGGVLEALREASFYVSASVSDGASSSLLEAMAAGLFPILSDIPANREWITDGENGLLFPVGDHDALASCMRRVMCGEQAWIEEAVASNYRLVAERANVDVSMTQLAGILQSHARGRRAQHR